MTNLKQNIATNNDVKIKSPESIKDSLGGLIVKKGNPHRQLWLDYLNDKISGGELHKILRSKLLKTVYKMKRQNYPSEPTVIKVGKGKISKFEIKKIMEGWGKACNHIDCVNAGSKHWLGILLSDIVNGKLEAEQGKQEEIQELLSEYPGYKRKETKIAIDA